VAVHSCLWAVYASGRLWLKRPQRAPGDAGMIHWNPRRSEYSERIIGGARRNPSILFLDALTVGIVVLPDDLVFGVEFEKSSGRTLTNECVAILESVGAVWGELVSAD